MKRLVDTFGPGDRVWVSTLNAESALLGEELAADGERAADVTFMGVQFPGIDKIDYLALHPRARSWGCFASPSLRTGWREGRADLVPADYQAITRVLQTMAPVDVTVAQLSPPDAQGWCSPGVSADFLPLVWPISRKRVAHINPSMPATLGSFRVHISEIDSFVEADRPVATFRDTTPGPIEAKIGALVAALIPDGATLQFGIGSVPLALAGALADHRDLRLHTGMVTSTVQTLWEGGALRRDARITTGVVLGDQDLQAFCASSTQLWLTDVRQTHDPFVMGSLPNFVAINSAVEVDLFGQVNSERGPKGLLAGAGGLPAFAQGAWRSPGGRLIVCLPATASSGAISRIVPALGDLALCTLPRYLADTIVTEYGVAEVSGLPIDARAAALIKIAAPEHQNALAAAWEDTRRRL